MLSIHEPQEHVTQCGEKVMTFSASSEIDDRSVLRPKHTSIGGVCRTKLGVKSVRITARYIRDARHVTERPNRETSANSNTRRTQV
jgi:hypothetical protein